MDHTKCKTFIAFKHTTKDKDTYWIEGGWEYSEESPLIFPYTTKAEKDRVTEVYNSYIKNWGLKNVEAILFTNAGPAKLKIDKIEEPAPEPKVRKKRENKSNN